MNHTLCMGVKSYSTPPRGGAWEPFLSLGRSQAERHPHSDGDSQTVSRFVSSSSLSTITMKLTTIRSDGRVGALLIIHSLVFCFFCFYLIMEEKPSDEFPEHSQLPIRWWWIGSSWPLLLR